MIERRNTDSGGRRLRKGDRRGIRFGDRRKNVGRRVEDGTDMKRSYIIPHFVATPPPPPNPPTGLTAATISATQINLTWNASTDLNFKDYGVYRQGTGLLGYVTGTSFSNTGLGASTTYTYYVTGRLISLVESTPSGFVSATTQSSQTSAFAPNEPAGSTVIVDRQWNPTDPSIPGGVLPPVSFSGTDSFSMAWGRSGDGDDQLPYINTVASLSATIGSTVPLPPDGYATALGIFYPTGFLSGRCPFITYYTGAVSFKKLYNCCYVFMPNSFDSNGNNIKWLNIQQGGSDGSNHINMLCSVGTFDYRAVWLSLQGGFGNKECGGQGQLNDGVTFLTYPPQGTGPGWWTSNRGAWHMLEWYVQQETTPGVSGNGVFKAWMDGTLINYWNNLNFNSVSGGVNNFNLVKFIPYYGGGGSNATSNQYLVVGRWRVSGHN